MSTLPNKSDTLLRLAVGMARMLASRYADGRPKPGDLVVEVTGFMRPVDPDAIGYLVGHDQAPYHEGDPLDGSAPMREVWDVRPLSGRHQPGRDYQRWENAWFAKVPDDVRQGLRGLEIEA